MTETAVTKNCRLCNIPFVPGGSQINCKACGERSGDAHKAANQLKKAFKLAAVLAKHGVTAPQLSAANEECQGLWTMAAELAQVEAPSGVTQAMTIVLLAGASE